MIEQTLEMIPARWALHAQLTILLFPALFGSFLVHRFLLAAVESALRARGVPLGDRPLRAYFGTSLTLLLYSLLLLVGLPGLDLKRDSATVLSQIAQVALTISITWFIIRVILFTEDLLNRLFDISAEDNLRQRRMRTQLQFIMKLALIVVTVIGFAAVLMSFQGARRIGASLIASAGVASIVIGFAAQKSLANLIAGFQIAFTQPVRIDDVVIVEKEWGRVEEITLTYVVVRLWDLRRMVLPITYFVEKPFENWTRQSTDLLGTVFLYVDYGLPLDPVRTAMKRFASESVLWDRKVCSLQVTDATEKTMQLRLLLSSRNASELFDLRCDVREKMLAFLRENYPDSLPQNRMMTTREAPLG